VLRSLLAAVAVLLTLLLAPRADACPLCVRPHRLAASIRSARNIYLGQVERAPADKPAEVRVVKVLRGTMKQDQLVKVSLRPTRYRLGQILLLSDPTAKPTCYPVLALELEDEVRFLIQKNPRISSLAEAIRLAQGVSDEAAAAGFKYIRRRRKRATGLLIKAIDDLRPGIFSGPPVLNWDRPAGRSGDKLKLLITALLSGVDARSPGYARTRAFLLREVKRYLRHGWQDLNPKVAPSSPDIRGIYLNWLLSNMKAHGRLRKAVWRSLKRGYPRLKGEGIANAVYAAVSSGTSSPAAFKAPAPKKKDEATATGLYLAGIQLQDDASRAALKRARALTGRATLKKAIDTALN
jgi:hypothetical protein